MSGLEKTMESLTQEQIKQQIAELQIEHDDLDISIKGLLAQAGIDQIRVQRMKKRKLALKDEIVRLEDSLLPDIIA